MFKLSSLIFQLKVSKLGSWASVWTLSRSAGAPTTHEHPSAGNSCPVAQSSVALEPCSVAQSCHEAGGCIDVLVVNLANDVVLNGCVAMFPECPRYSRNATK